MTISAHSRPGGPVPVRGLPSLSRLASGFLLLAGLAPTPALAELVRNGSFEQTSHDFAAGWARDDAGPSVGAWSIDSGAIGGKSVRADWQPVPDAVAPPPALAQGDLALKAGEPYTLTFRARGLAPGLMLSVAVQPEAATGTVAPYLAATIALGDEWTQHRLAFTVPGTAAAGRAALRFVLRSRGSAWLDDVALDGVALAEGEVPRLLPRLAPPATRNLVPNGSFEAGADGWASLGRALGFGGNVAGLYGEVVRDGAREGDYAYRLTLGPGHTPESLFDCWPPERVVHHRLLAANRGWIEVEPQRRYTLSAWMRADRPGTRAVLQLVFSGDARQPTQTLAHEVTLGTHWERHAFTATAPLPGVYVAVGPDLSATPGVVTTFWADGIQLEAGDTPSAYHASEPVELGFDTGHYGNVFPAGAPVTFIVSTRNQGADAADVTVACRLTDYWDRAAGDRTLTLALPPAATGRQPLTLDLPPGFYRAHFTWAAAGRRHERTVPFAVIEPYAHADSPFGLNHAPTTAEALRQMRQAGVTWIRDWSANWQWAEPVPGALSFADIDPQIGRLRAEGANVLGLLPSNPSTNWASEAPDTVPAKLWYRLAYAPREPERLFAFMEQAAARYRDSVRHWEFLNEPLWVPDFCLPRAGGYTVASYVALLKGGAAAIRRGNPGALVVGGLAIQSEMPLGDEFVKAGGLDHVDIFNLHPYAGTRRPESFIPDLERIRAVMDTHAARKPLWATEAAYYGIDEPPFRPWKPPAAHFAANRLLPGERHAGDYLIRFSVLMLAHGVEKLFWHEPVSGDANIGIKDVENLFLGPGGVPRKAYAAVSALANVLGPAPRFAGRWPSPPTVAGRATRGVYGYAFTHGARAVLVAWTAPDPGAGADDRWTLLLPPGAAARSIVGAPLDGERIALSESPVYVVADALTPGELARRCGLEPTP